MIALITLLQFAIGSSAPSYAIYAFYTNGVGVGTYPNTIPDQCKTEAEDSKHPLLGPLHQYQTVVGRSGKSAESVLDSAFKTFPIYDLNGVFLADNFSYWLSERVLSFSKKNSVTASNTTKEFYSFWSGCGGGSTTDKCTANSSPLIPPSLDDHYCSKWTDTDGAGNRWGAHGNFRQFCETCTGCGSQFGLVCIRTPTTDSPTTSPTTMAPTNPTSTPTTGSPTSSSPTMAPTVLPTRSPTSSSPTMVPTVLPTGSPTSSSPTTSPTLSPTTEGTQLS